MRRITEAFLRFCLWQMRFEHAVGTTTGMNPRYLAELSNDITRMEGELLRLELRHV